MNNIVKNLRATCLDRNSLDDYVSHKVSYEKRVEGEWQKQFTYVLATDPQHAIEMVYARYL